VLAPRAKASSSQPSASSAAEIGASAISATLIRASGDSAIASMSSAAAPTG
jgi:hypothetical protein